MKRTYLITLALIIIVSIWGCTEPPIVPNDPVPTYATQLSGTTTAKFEWSYGFEEDERFVDLQVDAGGEVYLAMHDSPNGFQIVKTLPSGGEMWRYRYFEQSFPIPGDYVAYGPEPYSLILDGNGHIQVGGTRLGEADGFQSVQRVGFILETDANGTYVDQGVVAEYYGSGTNEITSLGWTSTGNLVYGGWRRTQSPYGPTDPIRNIFVNNHAFVTADTSGFQSTLTELKVDAADVIHTVGLGGISGEELHLLKTNLAGDLLYSQSWSDWQNSPQDFTGHCFIELLSNGKTILGAKLTNGTLLVLLNSSGNYESHEVLSGPQLTSAAECPNGDLIFSGTDQNRPYMTRLTNSLGTVWAKHYADMRVGGLYRVRNAPGGGFVACGWIMDGANGENGFLVKTDGSGNL